MSADNKKDPTEDFGRVVDILHNKAKLPSLRTYQGDVAEFIKEKNESVISIATKEKKREDEEEKVEKKKEWVPDAPKKIGNRENVKINLTALFLSVFLIIGGAYAIVYVFESWNQATPNKIAVNTGIIPYDQTVTLANVSKENLGAEFLKMPQTDGISIIKISNSSGHLISKGQDFLNFIEASRDLDLRRNLKDDFAVGLISRGNNKSSFLIITVSDFGRAFSGMLEWEEKMKDDLYFLIQDENTASSTGTTTDTLVWKDLIVKNKDARALVDQKNSTKIAYAFLDKETILIVNNIWAIGEISSIFSSRAIAR